METCEVERAGYLHIQFIILDAIVSSLLQNFCQMTVQNEISSRQFQQEN